ncbi:hypothetical protein NLG97_g5216 [Lecanicillium saksenae]|uniref:Uncharacterized protein n=1 Tax=Lecanicillium saksenae TaxID=468837 RepID=A0ACC1QUD7_9HYPO|nr:hypothetical protein NLG97_g5216 [Lecanicillium saksenae]
MTQIPVQSPNGGSFAEVIPIGLPIRLSAKHALRKDPPVRFHKSFLNDSSNLHSSTVVTVIEDVKAETRSKIDKTVTSIMDILETFSLQQHGNNTFMGRDVFSPRVRRHVAAGRKITMVLPAFPAKSINVVDKVMGTRPDFGEELALDRLHDLCSQIGRVYEPGAKVIIATDGACYNGKDQVFFLWYATSLTNLAVDLTGVTDDNLWEYGATLRKMVEEKGYQCIDFVRIMNLVGLHHGAVITKERFINLLEPSRRELMAKYGDPNFDANACIRNDPDYKMTYDGYAKFLKKDLAYSHMKGSATSGKKWKAKVHETAKAMIARGVVSTCPPIPRAVSRHRDKVLITRLLTLCVNKAFAALILETYPESVRLSIHPSNPKNVTKISMPLIPQPNSFSMTPWHCAVAVDTHGNFRTAHVGELRQTHDVVLKDGHPYFFRERSPLYSWATKVEFQHLYGGGLIIRNASGANLSRESLSDSDKEKLAALKALQRKVMLMGFD